MILKAGWNCWRVEQAHRAAFLVDAASYFSALRTAIASAERQILIVGWDVDSRVRLAPNATDGQPVELLDCLNHALARRPDLEVFVLGWDFSVIFTFERELLPVYRFAARAHRRLRFQLDSAHPIGGSHHQKIVVIDDRLAFAGGLDLAIRRWDDPEHLAVNPHRRDPNGLPYPPVHDVQMAVDGEAARALGDMVRDRWLAATGERLAPTPAPAWAAASPASTVDPWPPLLAPDLVDVPVGISRTQAARAAAPEVPEVREILNLTLDAIAAARRSIYIESQYFTSAAVGLALAARLQERDGPEIAVVLPREECGWLETHSMGIMRARLIDKLRAADGGARLRLYYPSVPGLDGGCVNVHAKVLVVDDQLMRIGSANLSNRSMGLDTECDLSVDAAGDPGRARAITRFRDRLLAEHLGASPDAVAGAIAHHDGSLLAAIQGLGGGARTLAPLVVDATPRSQGPYASTDAGARGARPGDSPLMNLAFLDGLVCDPEQPAPDLLLDRLVPSDQRHPVRRSLLSYAAVFLAVFAIAAVWRFTPLRQYLDMDKASGLARALRGHPAAPLLVLGGYLAGAIVLFPITPLLAATALVFGPLASIVYSLVGALSGALLTYGIGRLIGRRQVAENLRWLSGPRAARIRDQLRRRGVVAVVAARMLPVGNFSLINLIAGALPIRLRDFMIGNLIGLLPGVLGLALFADRLEQTLRHPSPRGLLVMGVVVVGGAAAIGALRRRLARAGSPPRTAGKTAGKTEPSP